MIREYQEHIPDNFTVSAPAVVPWTRFPSCPKCGHTMGAGIWLLAVWRAARGECAQNYVYCAGDQNSTLKVPGLNLETGGMKVMDIRVPCFGVFTEHLHLGCGRCRFGWLMACKGGK